MLAASPAPAATCRRRSSPTPTSRSASTPATNGSSRAPASASATSLRRTRRRATSRCTPRAPRSRRPASTPRGRRSHHRRDDDAGHGVPVAPRASCRTSSASSGGPAFDVQAVCSGFVYALARRRPVHASPAACAQRAGRRRRNLSRASSTGTIAAPACCSATAPARSCSGRPTTPGILAAHLHADGSHADILLRAGHSCRRPRHRHAVPAHGRQRGVQVRGARCWPTWPKRRWPTARHRPPRHRLADSAPGEHPHHRGDGEEARPADWSRWSSPSTPRQHVGGVDSAGARRGRARRTHPAPGSTCCCEASAAASPGARYCCKSGRTR